MNNTLNRLQSGGIKVEYVLDYDFSRNSTVGVGGKAEIALFPRTLKETTALCDFFIDEDIEFVVLGNSSNVLPPEGVFRKPVIVTKKLSGVEISDGVFVEAGATVGALLKKCVEYGRGGAEFLAGIPCTIGGATYMNAGAGGKYISDIVKKVLVYRRKRLSLISNRNCAYEYKKSVFMRDDCVILGVELELDEVSPEAVSAEIEAVLRRRTALPKGKSMGCVFKNPLGDSAGRLIERAGLKGVREGGAVVSEAHANFIINEGRATREDFLRLIGRIKTEVFHKCGVILEEEIRVVK